MLENSDGGSQNSYKIVKAHKKKNILDYVVDIIFRRSLSLSLSIYIYICISYIYIKSKRKEKKLCRRRRSSTAPVAEYLTQSDLSLSSIPDCSHLQSTKPSLADFQSNLCPWTSAAGNYSALASVLCLCVHQVYYLFLLSFFFKICV